MREIAAALLIDRSGRLLLQLRDNIAGILQPGKVGLFGGHREGEESLLRCAIREITEEIGWRFHEGRFEHLMSLDGPDPEIQGGLIRGEIYVVRNVASDRLTISEGRLLILSVEKALCMTEELTPIASLAIGLLKSRKRRDRS